MARMISIISGKGGVGKTTVAINLACALGLLNKKVSLVDLNFTTSHLAIEFGFIPEITLNDVLTNNLEIKKAVYPFFNINLIPASLSLSDLNNLELSNLKEKFEEISTDFDIILFDSAPGFGREALTSIQLSDEAILVSNPATTSVADIIKCKSLVSSLGKTVLGVVINRYRKKSFEIEPQEIANLVELPLLAVIKENENILKSEAKRMPFIFYKRNEAEEFIKLACLLTGEEYKKPSFFEKIFSIFKS